MCRSKGTFLLAFCLLLVPALSYSWEVTTVDSQYGTGLYNSIALDSEGYPRIAYMYSVFMVGDALRYASYDGEKWTLEDIVQNENKGLFTSLALDSYDNPRIACTEGYPPRDLYYVRYLKTGWFIETVDSVGDVGFYCSITLDTAGAPHISYLDTTNHDLKYAYKDCLGPDKWEIETVDSNGIVGEQTSLTLDSNGYPHIAYAYFHDATRDLKYTRWDGKKWHFEILDLSLGFCYPSLAIDSLDYPHIAYHDFENGYLKYVRWNGYIWEIEIVDKIGAYGGSPSLALDAEGYPHITYHDYNSNFLKYAKWDGEKWHIEDVDDLIGTGSVYISKSLALDKNGNAYISYYSPVNSQLKFACNNGDIDKTEAPINDTAPVAAFHLGPAYPNPTDNSAIINFALPHECTVNLDIFDMKGRKVKEIIDGEMAAGEHEREITGLSAGLYLYRLETDDYTATKKLIVR